MRSGSCYVPHKADDAEYTRSCITVMRYVRKLWLQVKLFNGCFKYMDTVSGKYIRVNNKETSLAVSRALHFAWLPLYCLYTILGVYNAGLERDIAELLKQFQSFVPDSDQRPMIEALHVGTK